MKEAVPARLNQSRRLPRLRGTLLLCVLTTLVVWIAPFASAQIISAPTALLPLSGPSLIGELGCVLCHTEMSGRSTLRESTPDLGSAGLRYRTAYLYDFLLQPRSVRRHLGRARMPSFHLSSREALALALFLETQTQAPSGWPELPESLRERLNSPPRNVSKAELEREFSQGLACLSCHSLEGVGGQLGPELAALGHQLQPAWIKSYLVAPAQYGVPPQIMPPQFFQLSSTRAQFEELLPHAADRIVTIADYLATRGAEKSATLEAVWQRVRQEYSKVTPADGERLFRALNCAACHRHPTIQPRTDRFAPDLTLEGSRVKPDWLLAYLKQPAAIRPGGVSPQHGARMPDFRLRHEEAATLAQFLSSQGLAGSNRLANFQPQPLSAFSRAKAQTLLETKLSCLGCHQLGDAGGRIGPNLSNARERLQPAYVFSIIDSPERIAPHSVMPDLPLPPPTVELLANHLLEGGWKTTNAASTGYLSPLDWPAGRGLAVASEDRSAAANYERFCVACHGINGRGDGFNARFLNPPPTRHADPVSMAKRPDDTLFDGIHSGGLILNRSPQMPAWGGKLSAREIRDLVAHLRRLCQCEGPSWSRDNVAAPAP